ncbi:MAG: hypothetical protein JW732_06005 [Dehalococcoidia bacterium]|nr:hypothetical protein [Dehalococcoidia bacterium]
MEEAKIGVYVCHGGLSYGEVEAIAARQFANEEISAQVEGVLEGALA